MKNAILFLLTIVCCIVAMSLISRYRIKREETRRLITISNIIGEKRYLMDLFDISMYNNKELTVDTLTFNRKNQIIQAKSEIELPCLIIYIPSSQNVCMSCINYAILSVKENIPNIYNSKNCCIVSAKHLPILQERIYKKKIFHLEDTISLNVSYPIYFLLTENINIILPFIPNAQYATFCEKYLRNIKNNIGYN